MPVRPRLTPAIADVRRAIRESFAAPELAGAKSVLLAVSGGPDSMALALASSFELPKLGIKVFGAVINHNLQAGSKQIAGAARERLLELGIESVVIDIDVPKGSKGPEAQAREARYAALERHRAEISADFILTGHNLDDQAETVLLGLTRGSGLRSISGMKLVDGFLVRPLLGIQKAELVKACSDSGVKFWEDPHNQDDAYTRVRIRKLMQKIELELGPGVSEALGRTATLASEVDEFLTDAARELIGLAAIDGAYSVAVLRGSHPAPRNKALQLICLEHGAASVSHSQVMSIAELITNWHGQKPLSLSGITVERVREQILFRQPS